MNFHFGIHDVCRIMGLNVQHGYCISNLHLLKACSLSKTNLCHCHGSYVIQPTEYEAHSIHYHFVMGLKCLLSGNFDRSSQTSLKASMLNSYLLQPLNVIPAVIKYTKAIQFGCINFNYPRPCSLCYNQLKSHLFRDCLTDNKHFYL